MHKKEKISITLDSDIVSELKSYAKRDDRTLSQYINHVLKRYLQEFGDKQNQ